MTPLCSPTRASLLTGRNHHRWACGPSPTSTAATPTCAVTSPTTPPRGRGTPGRGLRHLRGRQVAPVPMEDASAAGPYDQWPLQRGFDRFYGFLEGETDQFSPDLVHDNHHVEPPASPDDGYHLSEDLVDHAIRFVHDSVSSGPTGRSSPTWPSGPCTPPTRPRPTTSSVPRTVRRRLGRGARPVVRTPDRVRAAARRHRARPAQPGSRALGLAAREPAATGRPPPGGVRRLPRAHRRPDRAVGRRPGRARRTRQHHRHPAVGQRGQPGGRPVRRHARDEVLQHDARDPRRGRRADRRHRRAPQPRQLPVGLGPGRQHAVQVVQAEHPRRRGPRPAHRALAVRHHRRGGDPRPVPPRRRHRPHHLRARGRRRPRGLPRAGAAARSRACPCATPSTRPTAHRQAGPVLRDDGPPGHLRRRVEGGHPPPVGRALRRRRLGALPPRRGPLRVPRPGRRRCPRRWPRLVELWWAEAEDQGVLPLDDRTIELFFTRYRDGSPHPTSRHYSYFPPMSPLPGQVAPSLGGRGLDMAAVIERPRGRRRGALRLRHRELRGQLLRPGRPAGPRLQLLRRPPPWSSPSDGAGGPVGGRRPIPADREGGEADAAHRRRAVRDA